MKNISNKFGDIALKLENIGLKLPLIKFQSMPFIVILCNSKQETVSIMPKYSIK